MTEINIEYQGDLRTHCIHQESGAEILTDAPKDHQGLGRAFSPTDLVAAAVGSCTLTIMGIAARRLNVDMTGATAQVKKEMQTSPRRIGKITVAIAVPQQFDESTTQKLLEAAHQCPVLHSLSPEVQVDISFKWG